MKLENIRRLRRHRRALSPIFATLILTAIVITFGTVAYYYASNAATNATDQLSIQTATSQQSVSERILIERVELNSGHLVFYVLNYGSANNVQFIAIMLTHNSQIEAINIQPAAFNIPKDTSTINLQDGENVLPLNSGEEGCFAVEFSGASFPSDIRLVTKSGSVFTYANKS